MQGATPVNFGSSTATAQSVSVTRAPSDPLVVFNGRVVRCLPVQASGAGDSKSKDHAALTPSESKKQIAGDIVVLGDAKAMRSRVSSPSASRNDREIAEVNLIHRFVRADGHRLPMTAFSDVMKNLYFQQYGAAYNVIVYQIDKMKVPVSVLGRQLVERIGAELGVVYPALVLNVGPD